MGKLEVVDFLDIRDGQIPEGAPNAAGVAQRQYQCPSDQWWLVDSIMVRTNSVAISTLLVFVGGQGRTSGASVIPVDEDLIDGTSTGDLDTSDRSSPIRVLPGQYLTFRWEGLTAASVAKLHFQGRILKRTS